MPRRKARRVETLIETDTNDLKVLNHPQKEKREVLHYHEIVQVSYLKCDDQKPLKRNNPLRKIDMVNEGA